MAKATIILGLCGSGKTYLSEKISKETGAKIFEGIEHHKTLPCIIQYLKNGHDCVLEEMAYSTKDGREYLVNALTSQVEGVVIEWICFENDLESANWNVQKRTNKRDIKGHISINMRLSKVYTYPDGATIIPISRI